jgi:protein tyrosine/serine phosphatase
MTASPIAILITIFLFVSRNVDNYIVVVQDPINSTKKIILKGFDNFYKVGEGLYRSEQPNRKGMRALESFGIKSVINLREKKTDNRKAKHTDLVLVHIPIRTSKMNYNDVLLGLQAIQEAEKPVLVHCLHGSDRTGAIVAASRMVNDGWSREAAIKEFLEDKYGYRQKLFPNILNLLENLDLQKLRRDLGISD